MKRGSVLPLLLIVAVFLLIPLCYWFFVYRDSQTNVKGAKVSNMENGAFVTINSKSGTWELDSFLCKTRSECLGSLSSGEKLDTKGGGNVVGYEIGVVYQSQWSDYEFIKLFARSGWGTTNRHFGVTDKGVVSGTSVEQVTSDGATYEVVLIPTRELKSGYFKSVVFSD